jgi:hypothetical protein
MAVIIFALILNQNGLPTVLQTVRYGKSSRIGCGEIAMRALVERTIDGNGVMRPGRGARSVTVNLAESPLSWLMARGLLDARQFEAGERLRGDYERAALGPSVTMRWDRTPIGAGVATGLDPTLAQISAKQRFDAAVAALGNGLADIAWRVICAGERLPVAEKELGWPTRSGRLVLGLALDRLGDHYGLH